MKNNICLIITVFSTALCLADASSPDITKTIKPTAVTPTVQQQEKQSIATKAASLVALAELSDLAEDTVIHQSKPASSTATPFDTALYAGDYNTLKTVVENGKKDGTLSAKKRKEGLVYAFLAMKRAQQKARKSTNKGAWRDIAMSYAKIVLLLR